MMKNKMSGETRYVFIISIYIILKGQTDEKINFDGWKLTPRVYSKFAILTFFDWVSMSKKTEINYERETEGRDRLYRCPVSTD